MSADIENVLNDAYALIEDEKLLEARELLQPLLTSDKDNATVWWLYAHAAEDADAGREALNTTLMLNPNYPGASDLLQKARGETGDVTAPSVKKLKSLAKQEDFDSDFDDIDLDDDSADGSLEDVQETGRSRRSLGMLAIAVLIVVLVIIVVIAISSGGQTTPVVADKPTATSEPVAIPITATTISMTVTPVPEVTADTSSVDELEALKNVLQSFDVGDNDLAYIQTPLGRTLVVTVCGPAGAAGSQILADVMEILAQESSDLSEPLDGMGVNLVACDQGGASRVIVTPISAATDYANGTIEAKDFQRQWQPVG